MTITAVVGYTQLATYWALSSIDGYGKRTLATPVEIYVRWEDRTDLEINVNGEAIPSKARVYVLQDMLVGEYLALGDQTATTNPETIDSALQIKAYLKTPSLRGDEYTRKVLL